MRQIDWYIDTARDRLKLPSDRQLAPHLGVSRELVSQWRTRRAWPSAASMEKLADICEVPRMIAVAELGTWREPEVSTWRKMLDVFTRSAAALCVALLAYFVDFDGGANASATSHQVASVNYTLCDKLLRLMARVKAVFTGFSSRRHSIASPFFPRSYVACGVSV